MTEMPLSIRETPGPFPGSRVYRIACRHGVSAAALVPGIKPVPGSLVLDLVLPGHNRRYGCRCAPWQVPVRHSPIVAEGVVQ
jgi:hypothetical protein